MKRELRGTLEMKWGVKGEGWWEWEWRVEEGGDGIERDGGREDWIEGGPRDS